MQHWSCSISGRVVGGRFNNVWKCSRQNASFPMLLLIGVLWSDTTGQSCSNWVSEGVMKLDTAQLLFIFGEPRNLSTPVGLFLHLFPTPFHDSFTRQSHLISLHHLFCQLHVHVAFKQLTQQITTVLHSRLAAKKCIWHGNLLTYQLG